MKKHLMNSTAVCTSLIGKTPASYAAVKLGPAYDGRCMIWLTSQGEVIQLSPWTDLKAA